MAGSRWAAGGWRPRPTPRDEQVEGHRGEEVRSLEKLRDEARVPKTGRAWTVSKWLTHWLEEIARPSIRESSYQAYRTAVETHWSPPSAASGSTASSPNTWKRCTARWSTTARSLRRPTRSIAPSELRWVRRTGEDISAETPRSWLAHLVSRRNWSSL